MARAAVWMRADSKGLHELLEAQPLDAAQQVFRLHLETVEGDLVFLHAAIAEHLDLGAAHAFCRERIFVGAARLFGEQHGQAAMAGFLRIGAHQQRHQVGAHRMGDPGLVAVDLVDVALAHRAGLDRGEIGAGVRLGEHGGRQHFAGGELRQPFFLLLGGAAAEDQFGGDLRARAERADADIAARQFLGDHAHGLLAEPHAAEFFRDGEPEHAELGHLRDDLERDVAVGAVPGLRVADHFAVGEFAHFLADRFQRLVEAARADRGAMAGAHQLDQAGAPFRGVAAGDQAFDHRIDARGNLRRRQAPDRSAAPPRPGSSECRRRSGRYIRRARCARGVLRVRRRCRCRPCAPV